MKTLVTVALTVLVLGLLATGFVWSGTYNIGADDPHTRPIQSILETLRERSIEAHSADMSVPELTRVELIRSGAGNYDAMCKGCHVAPGMNESEISKGLYPAPPNLTRIPIDDPAEAFWVIKHGIKASGMPAWGKSMEDHYIWGLVAFVRELPKPDSGAYQAAIAASEGHSHGGGETRSDADATDHEHDGGADHQGIDESAPHPAVHTHADGKQHVHTATPRSPVDAASAFHQALSSGDAARVKDMLDPAMGRYGMAEHQDRINMGHMRGPPNTLPMMWGESPFGNLEMGGMFTVIKVRDTRARGDYGDPGWYRHPKGTVAWKVSDDPNFGSPPHRPGAAESGPISIPPGQQEGDVHTLHSS